MLLEMYIKNFVLIEEQRLDFSPGLNVLTGETGAGKSIIMDALGLVLGERSRNDYIRDETQKAVVEAVFELQPANAAYLFLLDQGLLEAEEREAVFSREMYPGGRNTARINGRTVPISVLKQLGELLVDMQSQNDRYDFLMPTKYLDYLDSYIENNEALRAQVADSYARIKSLQGQLAGLESERQQREQRIDFLQYQVKEIEDSRLREGEEEELKTLRVRISNAGKYMQGCSQMLDLLNGSEHGSGAYDLMAAALHTAAGLKQDQLFAQISTELDNISCSLQDICAQLSAFRDTLDFEPDQLEKLEDRLYLIGKLEKKYGASIREVLAYQEQCLAELEGLAHSEEHQDHLRQELSAAREEYGRLAAELSRLRRQAAGRLEARVVKELAELNMPDIKFVVQLGSLPQPSARGMDQVEFLFSPNTGEELRPAARIASGGEVSRLILAMKTALAEIYALPTLIFDEIDSGLGGTALNTMAKKIGQLAEHHQLILVTHSPQLASYANQHLYIDKYVANGRTLTSVKKLEPQDRITELARMLDGDNYTAQTLAHARELLSQHMV